MNEFVLIPKNILASVVGTLKMIDNVHGYDNMDRLVGCVITLEKAMQQGSVSAVPAAKEDNEDVEIISHPKTAGHLDQDGVEED